MELKIWNKFKFELTLTCIMLIRDWLQYVSNLLYWLIRAIKRIIKSEFIWNWVMFTVLYWVTLVPSFNKFRWCNLFLWTFLYFCTLFFHCFQTISAKNVGTLCTTNSDPRTPLSMLNASLFWIQPAFHVISQHWPVGVLGEGVLTRHQKINVSLIILAEIVWAQWKI